MTGHTCPECGGRQDAGIRPGCACGPRTAQLTGEEQRSARSADNAAEIAAAEDFDPLRIRPYVTLNDDMTAGPGELPDGPPTVFLSGVEAGSPDAATTMPLFLPGAAGGPLPGTAGGDEARRRTAGSYPGTGPDPVQPRRRRPFAVLAVAAAVTAVVGTAAFAGGLFGGNEDGRGEALPETTTGAPDASDEPARSVSESPSAPASASPSASASKSPSASASASASRAPSPTASRSAAVTAPARPTPSPSTSGSPAPTASAPAPAEVSGPTLRRGDHGDGVAELQNRLQELWLYRGPADGNYTDRVENGVRTFQSYMSIRTDPAGVYGPDTRRALEQQTSGEGDSGRH